MQLLTWGILFLFTAAVPSQELHQLQVEFTGLEEMEGSIRVALYASEEGFLEGKNGYREDRIPLTDAKICHYAFRDVPSGQYAIAAYHDLNDNGELDTNVLGIPKEPYAFSKNPAAKWRAPKFGEVVFDLNIVGEDKQRLVLKKWGKR